MMSKWISADSIINKFNSHVGFTTCADVKRAIKLIREEPTIDLVRCKDCKWWLGNLTDDDALITDGECCFDWDIKMPQADDYCSYGEREGE